MIGTERVVIEQCEDGCVICIFEVKVVVAGLSQSFVWRVWIEYVPLWSAGIENDG